MASREACPYKDSVGGPVGLLGFFLSHEAEVSVQEGGDERVNDSYRQIEGLWPSSLCAHLMYLIHIINKWVWKNWENFQSWKRLPF